MTQARDSLDEENGPACQTATRVERALKIGDDTEPRQDLNTAAGFSPASTRADSTKAKCPAIQRQLSETHGTSAGSYKLFSPARSLDDKASNARSSSAPSGMILCFCLLASLAGRSIYQPGNGPKKVNSRETFLRPTGRLPGF